MLEFRRKVVFEFPHEFLHIACRLEAPAEPHPVGDRHFRPAEQRPALAQVGRRGFDEDRLHRHFRAACDQPDTAHQWVHRQSSRARSFRKDQQVTSGGQVFGRAHDHAQRRIVADVTCKACACAEENVVHQPRLHDARDVGQARDHHHGVEQARMVRGENQRLLPAQRIEFAQIEAARTDQGQEAQIAVEDPADHASPEPPPE
ncbi:hypothetical protein ebA7077 [Aromatoleum aromaticum EbN1]|uniref:Uncharacterized protein n=1 Tax=Aromatoleum aromaticum (strain DSM 19018 / LMG 30748 / EbN1) TaxID=76114 RepID=Q5NXS3_AROAE|nr:hypothetical protein ebA7077 [Aromatoleum aromaticum EbN1]